MLACCKVAIPSLLIRLPIGPTVKEDALAETAIRKRQLSYKDYGYPDKARFPPPVQNSHTAEKNLNGWRSEI